MENKAIFKAEQEGKLVKKCGIEQQIAITDLGDCKMSNNISNETIEYIGILAKLELSEEEKKQAKKDMEKMLDYIDKLGELNTEGIEPMSHIFPVNNVFREDIVLNKDEREDIFRNAPDILNGYFKVPKTV